MADTTIPVSREVKDRLEEEKQTYESWNETLLRLVGAAEYQQWTEDDIRELARDEAETILQQYR